MLRTTTIKGTLQDNGAGRPATVTLEVDEPDPATVTLEHRLPAPLVLGTTVKAEDFALYGGRGRGSRFGRTFSAPDEGFLPWTHARRKLPAGVAEFHSWKDWPSDTAAVAGINQLLDGMPPALLNQPALLPELAPYDPDGYAGDAVEYDGFSLLLSYCHEGERNFVEAGLDAKEWRRRHRLAYRTVRQHRNGRRVGYMPIQTLTWLVGGTDKGNSDPLAWWAGVGDFAGIDCYAPSITSGAPTVAMYPPPAKFLDLPMQLANGTGRRLFLPELGIIRQGSPAEGGNLRAAWIKAVVAYLDEQGAAGVAWWDALGTRDFRLADTASAGAWSAELTRNRA